MIQLAAVLLAAGAPASAPLVEMLEPAFANTIVSTYPDGRQAKAWLNRDGSYRGQGRSGGVTSGRWSVKGEKICLRQSRPVPIPMAYCTEMRSGGVGSTWKAKAATGEPVRLEVVAGR